VATQHDEIGDRFPVEALRDYTFRTFLRAGMPEEDARVETDSLIEANLRGVDTHGLTRMLGIYVERLRRGAVNPRPQPRVVEESASTALVDGDNGMGAVVASWAIGVCIRKAREAGSAWVGVRNSNHFGTCAYWAMQAARADLVGFATTNGPSNMAPWGGVTPYMSTNPLAFAVPGSGGRSVVVDMATSVAAKGKIILAAKKGQQLPEGWAMDRRGRPTTDPQEAIDGLVMPLGGHKGYALSLMIDLLCGILTGASFGPHIGKLYGDFDRPQDIGHLFSAVDVSRFVPIDEFKARVDQLCAEVRSVELAEGFSRIYIPGEIEQLEVGRRLAEGIPIPSAVVEEFVKLGDDLGVPFPLETARPAQS
jgi:LDH2 family malate/lactate/ureidoglycolate dehydrogenase